MYCRRTLFAKSYSNGVVNYYSKPRLVLLLSSPPPSQDVASSLRLGILAEFFDSNANILDIGCVEVQIVVEGARGSDLYCVRGSRALEPQKAV